MENFFSFAPTTVSMFSTVESPPFSAIVTALHSGRVISYGPA